MAWAAVPAAAMLAQAAEGPSDPRETIVGRSTEGRPIVCQVWGEGPETLLIIATIHGNEAAGTPLVGELAAWLAEHPETWADQRIVVLPVANPDGLARNLRFSVTGVDLNRNFPAGNWRPETRGEADVKVHGETPLSEPESRALMRVLCTYYPSRVVSIHQPLACVDYDGPAEGLARAMADACPLPLKQLGSRPGSLGSFVGLTLRRAIVTLELPGDAGDDGAALWRTYGGALRAAVYYRHPVEDPPAELDPPP
jgi:protein MpaA